MGKSRATSYFVHRLNAPARCKTNPLAVLFNDAVGLC